MHPPDKRGCDALHLSEDFLKGAQAAIRVLDRNLRRDVARGFDLLVIHAVEEGPDFCGERAVGSAGGEEGGESRGVDIGVCANLGDCDGGWGVRGGARVVGEEEGFKEGGGFGADARDFTKVVSVHKGTDICFAEGEECRLVSGFVDVSDQLGEDFVRRYAAGGGITFFFYLEAEVVGEV